MEKYYEFAGVGILVRIPDEAAYDDERSLAPFRVEAVKEPHQFDFELVDTLPQDSGMRIALEPAFAVYSDGDWSVRYIGAVQNGLDGAYVRAAHRGKEHRVQLKADNYPDRVGAKTVLNCIVAEHLIAQNHGFVFHSSYIEVDGKAILFTAPSETGKSTQADLWHKYRNARIINGDRSAVRWVNDGAYACGIPFSGSSTYCENVTLPLAAIVYLKQAPQTTIRCIKGAEAFRKVWEGCSVNTWDRADVDAISHTVMRVLESVPVFELACTPDESAVIALEGALEI